MRGAFNAVFVECEAAGELMFYGPGAGGAPTASAVLGDIVTVARHRLAGVTGAGESTYADCEVVPMGETRTRYHVVLDVEDQPGVLASVAQLFADEGVSIETLQQDGRGDDARLVVVTHTAPDRVLRHTVGSLEAPRVRARRDLRPAGRGARMTPPTATRLARRPRRVRRLAADHRTASAW